MVSQGIIAYWLSNYIRGYFENIVLQTLSQPMIVFSRFATDMMMFTQQEMNFFALPGTFFALACLNFSRCFCNRFVHHATKKKL